MGEEDHEDELLPAGASRYLKPCFHFPFPLLA